MFLEPRRPSRAGTALGLGLAFALVACADASVSPVVTDPESASLDRSPRAETSPPCDADNGGLTLPSGFCAVVVAKNVGLARHLVVRPNGDLYVAIDNAADGSTTGAVLALRDTDGDGKADVMQRFGPTGGNGIAWRSGQLFFAPDDRVLRYALPDNDLVPTGAPATVVSGLTFVGDHHRKTIVLENDRGGMFVNIGSASNACQVANRVPFSPGIEPCPELPTRAGVWRFDAGATGQTQASGVRFATELRNMNALAINHADGRLYGAQNGRDQLFDNWPTLFTARDDAVLPAEELFRIDAGKKYGWPYCYYDGEKNKKVLAPEYGGDGDKVALCGKREQPIAIFPAHWAPLSIAFYSGKQFPKQYQGGLFTAFHGSRFDPSLQPAGPGYLVTFTPWVRGKPSSTYQVFADGFAGGNPTPVGAAHRPLGLAQGPDGSLYITDDKAGWIWRVSYVGATNP